MITAISDIKTVMDNANLSHDPPYFAGQADVFCIWIGMCMKST